MKMFDYLVEENEHVKTAIKSRLTGWPGLHRDFIGSLIVFVKTYERKDDVCKSTKWM